MQTLEAEVESLKQGGATDDDESAAGDGMWTVKIASNSEPDTSDLEKQLSAEKAKLSDKVQGKQRIKGLDSRVGDAQKRVTDMESATEKYWDNGKQKTRDKYSSRDISAARVEVRKIEAERRTVQTNINRLEDQIRRTKSERQITGMTDDGKPVIIVARGVYFDAGTQLVEGETYQISGRGVFTDTSGKIFIKSAMTVSPTE